MSDQRPLFDPHSSLPSRALGQEWEDAINVNVRRKPGLFVRLRPWLLAVLILPSLVILSWFLAGHAVWHYSAVVTAFLLFLLTLSGFKLLDGLRARHFLLYGYFVLCWVAWTVVGYYWPMTEVRVKGELGNNLEEEPNCQLRVSYGGLVRVELDRPQESSFRFRGRFDPEQLRIEMMTPEGWVTRSFNAYSKEAYLDKIPVGRLYVDNRASGPVTLACGAWQAGVKGDSHATVLLPAAPKGVRRRLTINGKEAGAFEGENILVDTLGTRSYQLRTVVYETTLNRLFADPAKRLLPPERSFERGHVHHLPDEIDYFLASAPDRITVPTMYGLPLGKLKRKELNEIK
jgi:hypothetical protein